jgi:hypothetical protein
MYGVPLAEFAVVVVDKKDVGWGLLLSPPILLGSITEEIKVVEDESGSSVDPELEENEPDGDSSDDEKLPLPPPLPSKKE